MNDDPEIEMSPLCQEVSSGGNTVSVEIYEDGEGEWILEVVDKYGNSRVWDDSFPTDISVVSNFYYSESFTSRQYRCYFIYWQSNYGYFSYKLFIDVAY